MYNKQQIVLRREVGWEEIMNESLENSPLSYLTTSNKSVTLLQLGWQLGPIQQYSLQEMIQICNF